MSRFFTAPTLDNGAAPPGDWQADPERGASRVWQGPFSWVTTHGPAEVLWSFGRPRRAANLRMPDGTRLAEAQVTMESRFSLEAEDGVLVWRWLDGERWLRGHVAIGDDDLVLTLAPEDEVRTEDVEMPTHDMEAALVRSSAAADFCADDNRAGRLYGALCNVTWRDGEGVDWSCSWRHAGGIVAEIRRLGEEYVDWYCRGCEGEVAPEVAALLADLGWRPKTKEEEVEDRAAALTDIVSWTERPGGERPEWFRATMDEDFAVPPEGAYQRLRWLAATGRVTQVEFNSAVERMVG